MGQGNDLYIDRGERPERKRRNETEDSNNMNHIGDDMMYVDKPMPKKRDAEEIRNNNLNTSKEGHSNIKRSYEDMNDNNRKSRTYKSNNYDTEELLRQIDGLKKENTGLNRKLDSQQSLIQNLMNQSSELQTQVSYLVNKMNYIEPYVYQMNNMRLMQSNVQMPTQLVVQQPSPQVVTTLGGGYPVAQPNNMYAVQQQQPQQIQNLNPIGGGMGQVQMMANQAQPMLRQGGGNGGRGGNSNGDNEKKTKWQERKDKMDLTPSQIKKQGNRNKRRDQKDNENDDDCDNGSGSDDIYVDRRRITKPKKENNKMRNMKDDKLEIEEEFDDSEDCGPKNNTKKGKKQ